MDSVGHAHIGYDADESKLHYATNSSGEWRSVTIDDGGVWEVSALAIDAADHLHITYTYSDGTHCVLKHASNASGSWVTEVVDSAACFGEWASMAVDSSGHLHIAYNKRDRPGVGTLNYATDRSGHWTTHPIQQNALTSTSIAVDSRGQIHIVAYTWERVQHIRGTWR